MKFLNAIAAVVMLSSGIYLIVSSYQLPNVATFQNVSKFIVFYFLGVAFTSQGLNYLAEWIISKIKDQTK